MILIMLLGVDQFQAASFVADIQDETAQAFETSPEDILFYAPDSFLIYRGVDQTSYQLSVVVQAPSKYQRLEAQASKFLLKVFSQNHVHVRVLFEYFDAGREHEYINSDYPRFMTEANMAHFSPADEEPSGEPYMGNAMAGYQQKVKEHEQEEIGKEKDRQKHRLGR